MKTKTKAKTEVKDNQLSAVRFLRALVRKMEAQCLKNKTQFCLVCPEESKLIKLSFWAQYHRDPTDEEWYRGVLTCPSVRSFIKQLNKTCNTGT